VVTVSVRAGAAVKAEAAVVAEAHGMSMAALVRELLIRVAAGDKGILVWLDKARR
jgi:DNA-damage-inducible protein J